MKKCLRGTEKSRECSLKPNFSEVPVRFERITCFSHFFEKETSNLI